MELLTFDFAGEQSLQNETTVINGNPLVNITNNIQTCELHYNNFVMNLHPLDSDNNDHHEKKKRGRPVLNKSTSQKFSVEGMTLVFLFSFNCRKLVRVG